MLMVRPRLRVGQEAFDSKKQFFRMAIPDSLWKRAAMDRMVCRNSGTSTVFGLYNGAVAFVIRDFQPDDFEVIWRMDQECFPPGIAYSKPELRAYVRNRGAFTLLATEAGGKVQGFIVAQGGAIGHIITIDVVAPARRSGVGSLLLRSAEERLKAEGSRAVGLETAVDNITALSFYKRHGYSVIRTWPRYYSNGVDALVLRKSLA